VPYTLGIICYGWHEAAAVLVNDGHVVAAAEEERFTREKFDAGFPGQAIAFCLKRAGIQSRDLAAVGYGFNPRRKLLQKALHLVRYAPGSINLLTTRTGRLQRMNSITADLRERIGFSGPVYRFNHHLCHAASTFFASPFPEAAILTLDGIGDWEACWWGRGHGSQIEELGAINWPRSLGHVYAAFTEYLGFKTFSDEYRVMGLAPCGQPVFVREMAEIFWPTRDGYDVNSDYFTFPTGHVPRFSAKVVEKFGPPLAHPGQEIPEHYRNIAASLQAQLETVVEHLVRLLTRQTGLRRLCLAGGVAMNCVANGKLLSKKIVDEIYTPPCASDAGTALGAAWLAWLKTGRPLQRQVLQTAMLGPEYTEAEIDAAFRAGHLQAETVEDPAGSAAELLSQGKVVAWFQGRMEFGQRALGARSILADPRRAEMKEIINAKVKFREPFRPFAPSVLEERANDFFHCDRPAPFMTEVYAVRAEKRPVIPAVTHVDGTARLQTVRKSVNPLYWQLIWKFGELTGVPVVLNTSFNVLGEPIVNTPAEAVATFLKTDLDALICGNRLVVKTRNS
jgi:carbamoyltransferase